MRGYQVRVALSSINLGRILVHRLSHRVSGCVLVEVETLGGLRILPYASEMMPDTSEYRNQTQCTDTSKYRYIKLDRTVTAGMV
jgi:hypothetical protein